MREQNVISHVECIYCISSEWAYIYIYIYIDRRIINYLCNYPRTRRSIAIGYLKVEINSI